MFNRYLKIKDMYILLCQYGGNVCALGDYPHYNKTYYSCCKDEEFKECVSTVDNSPLIFPTGFKCHVYNASKVKEKVKIEKIENNKDDVPEITRKKIIDNVKEQYPNNPDIISSVNNMISKVPTKVILNEDSDSIEFSDPHYLSAGAYGQIYTLTNKTSNDVIAVKVGKIDDDISTIENLKNSACKDMYIPSLVSKDKKFIIMEKIAGNLKDLVKIVQKQDNISILILLSILEKISVAFKCLFNIKLYYTDIKLENILYRCVDDMTINVILGDIGSAVKSNQTAIATYPPFDRFGGRFKKPTEKDVVWGIGILLIDLLNIQKNYDFSWNNVQKYYTEYYTRLGYRQYAVVVEKMKKKLEKELVPDLLKSIVDHDLQDLVKKIFVYNPQDRISLDDTIMVIKSLQSLKRKKFMDDPTQTDIRQ